MTMKKGWVANTDTLVTNIKTLNLGLIIYVRHKESYLTF